MEAEYLPETLLSNKSKVAGSVLVEVTGCFKLPNPSSRTMALGSTQPPTEMSTRNLPEGKGRPACKADLTAICKPRRLTDLWTSTACYRDSFTFTLSLYVFT
jgi:hypothetical protein